MPQYEILRHIVHTTGPAGLESLPENLIEDIISYLPASTVAALCEVSPKVLKIVCEQNRDRYFGYRKHLSSIFMPAIIYGAYERVAGEGVEEHSQGAKSLADVICNELGRNR
ncbi:hypothetical protein TWF506_006948 [Arthrobotrys conoides]|uniref:F-box domain-containing protein n=1 Tax=Arthrobotrys conoides TaxID=74498 RepID=A0AAN8NMV0_9PEZI